MVVKIHQPSGNSESSPDTGSALLNLGFRPFFLLAGLFSVAGMALWALIYHGLITFNSGPMTLFQWHSHEMLFGYGSAVIAGFLLTSVRNWTGEQTPIGNKLLLMVVAWSMARVMFAFGGNLVITGVLFNLAFLLGFSYSIGDKIFKVKQWRQLGILAVVVTLTCAELVVLFGLMQRNQWILSKAIYGTLYLELLLILIMGRRVVPFFIERGVGYSVELKQSTCLDVLVAGGFIGYALANLFAVNDDIIASIAGVVFVGHTIRLIRWYTKGIWQNPLLWSLFLAMLVFDVGFLAAALTPFYSMSSYLILHIFAVGGLGMVTLSMMSRVALGHTGRNIHRPHFSITFAFLLMVLALVARVVMPLVMPNHYMLWIGIAQIVWIISFAIFVFVYAPILVAPRIDNKPG